MIFNGTNNEYSLGKKYMYNLIVITVQGLRVKSHVAT